MISRGARVAIAGVLLLTQLAACAPPPPLDNNYRKGYLAQSVAELKKRDNVTTAEKKLRGILRQVATVDPFPSFPARIGIARIDHRIRPSSPTPIPNAELEIWQKLVKDIDHETESLVAVSPLVAALTAQAVSDVKALDYSDSAVIKTLTAIERIRLAAARQHIDYVLVYQVNSGHPAGVFGGLLHPWRELEARATAQAVLFDVMLGYPYVLTDGHARASAISPSDSPDTDDQLVVTTAEHRAVADLASKTGMALALLRQHKVAE